MCFCGSQLFFNLVTSYVFLWAPVVLQPRNFVCVSVGPSFVDRFAQTHEQCMEQETHAKLQRTKRLFSQLCREMDNELNSLHLKLKAGFHLVAELPAEP